MRETWRMDGDWQLNNKTTDILGHIFISPPPRISLVWAFDKRIQHFENAQHKRMNRNRNQAKYLCVLSDANNENFLLRRSTDTNV